MSLQPITQTIPIRQDEHRPYRVGSTRVLLDLIIYAYRQGNTPETIIDNYPTLTLDDVYLALGYYLRHRDHIDAYLRGQEALAEQARQQDQAKPVPPLQSGGGQGEVKNPNPIP